MLWNTILLVLLFFLPQCASMNLMGRDGIQVKTEQEFNDALDKWVNNHEANSSYRIIKLSGKRFVDDEIYDSAARMVCCD